MNRKYLIGVTVTVAVLLFSAWWFGLVGGRDPVVARLEAERDAIFRSGAEPTAEQRAAFFSQIQSLTDAQRRQLFFSSRPLMQERMRESLDQFFALSPAQQQQRLDEQVREIIALRARGEGPGFGPGGGPGGRFANLSPQERDRFRKERLDMIDPTTRAKMAEYREQLNDRLRERGQPPLEGPWFPPGMRPHGPS